jgi:pyridoxal phosphate phosphatase PHOSPHO2
MRRALLALKARPSSTALLLSNSNAVFIDTILRHHGLDEGVFEKIVTNPAEWDTEGCLRLRRLVDRDGEQHGCADCPINMCKGQVLWHEEGDGE